jgi:hypothetical protein
MGSYIIDQKPEVMKQSADGANQADVNANLATILQAHYGGQKS